LAFGESLKDYIGFTLTYLWKNPFDGTTSLFIYLIYSYTEVPPDIFQQGIDALLAYAKRTDCKTLSFVSTRGGIAEMVQRTFGAAVRSETFYVVDLGGLNEN
jgi:hypothetical protein